MSFIKSLFFFLIVFFYIFGPVFRPIGNWFDFIFITSIFLSLYGFGYLKLTFPTILGRFFPLFIVFFYAVFSIVVFNVDAKNEWIRFFLVPIRILTTLYGGYVIVAILVKSNKQLFFNSLLNVIYISILLHGVIMIVQLYSVPLKDFIYHYTAIIDEFRSTYEYNFRMGGLSGATGGSVLSVVQAIGILISTIIFIRAKLSGKLIIISGDILIMYSVLVSGRSGIWTVLIFLPIIVYLVNNSHGIIFFLKYILIVSFLLFSLWALVQVSEMVDYKSPTYYALKRSLDTFISFEESNKFEDETIQTVAEMWMLPDDFQTLMFGNSEHLINDQFNRTLHSDIGYVRNLWGFGIFFGILFWMPIVSCLLYSYKKLRLFNSAVLLFSLTLLMMFFQGKENFFYVRMFLSLFSLMLFSLYFNIKHSLNAK